MEEGVSIVIPTCNGGQIFSECLAAIKGQDYAGPVQLIVVDSGSTDKTVELAEKAGARVQKVDPKQFHHARTRNEAVSLADHGKIIFMVQDAVPSTDAWLRALAQTLDQYPVAAAYTAQMPHDEATPFARFEIESINEARGHEPVIQEIESLESYGEMPYHQAYRTIGLDDVCAIYRKDRLLETPFPEVDYAEDMAWAQKNLLMGYKILYNPRIKVKHSHNRSPQYAFRRQIINAFWCAKIMGRVEDDLAFLKVGDLKLLTSDVLHTVSGLRSDIFTSEVEYPDEETLLREILGKYPAENRLKRFLAGRVFRKQKPIPDGLRKLAGDIKTRIETLFHLIREKYGIREEEEQISLLDQVVANVMGRAYGEVYARRFLKDNISSSFEYLMRPFFHGV